MSEPSAPSATSFLQQLADWRALGNVGTDDLLGMVLPLLEQTAALHQQGLVAPLNGVDALSVAMGHLWFFNGDARTPDINTEAINNILPTLQPNAAVHITGQYSETRSEAGLQTRDKRLGDRADTEPRLAYYPDYIAWEQKAAHQDALTDVYLLGMIMGSLATGLDFTQPDHLSRFIQGRENLCRLNSRLHPLIALIICEMTALDRRQRPQDLPTLIQTLRHYRNQELDLGESITRQAKAGDQHVIQSHLRNKLFEISRRNRLLYFRETGSAANLTLGSVPHVLDHRSIKLEQLMLYNEYLTQALASGKPVALSRWLRFEDYPYLANSLDKIRLQAGRDAKEYGFSQLRLVLAFFRWHNLKEAREERINSPLILVPAQIQKKKGITDSYTLSADLSQAEINPVLRFHLQQIYGIELPEHIDASNPQAVAQLHHTLQQQINQSARGVELSLVDRPRIQLIARKAKRKLDDFKRKQRITGRGVNDYDGLAYSYQRDKFEPLGVQIFARNVRLAQAPARDTIAAANRSAVFSAMVNAETSVERDFYAIDQGQQGGEYQWELDLCALTLANFNYRKMTLVRDYTDLLEARASGKNFDTLFSQTAKATLAPPAAVALADQYHLLPADPSQAASVWASRAEQSYVIQGPPGTGKSQTITNLIADYLAQKKSVLFVCEKRVALDVVYHRLKQVGIEDLCALIHDSQGDKKAFIDDLEALYQQWLTLDQQTADQRTPLLAEINQQLEELEAFANAMQAPALAGTENLRAVLQRWVAGGGQRAALTTAERAQLPSLSQFEDHKKFLTELLDALHAIDGSPSLARSPVWCLRGAVAQRPDPAAELNDLYQRVSQDWPTVATNCENLQTLLGNRELNWQDLLAISQQLKTLLPLILDEQVKMLDPESLGAMKLDKPLAQWHTLVEALARAQASADGWQLDKVEGPALREALQAARDCEHRWWRFLSGRWRRAKHWVRTLGPGKITRYTQALEQAHAAFAARELLQQHQHELQQKFGFEDISAVAPLLQRAWRPANQMTALERHTYRACVAQAHSPDHLARLARDGSLRAMETELSTRLTAYHHKTPEALYHAVQALRHQANLAFELGDLLQQLDQLDTAFNHTVRNLDLPLADIEQAILNETLAQQLRKNSALNRFDGAHLQQLFNTLETKLTQLRAANAQAVIGAARARFHNNIQRASGSMANTSQREKDWRRAYNRGRKLLEREFEKTRAYKSIRELLAAESGELLRDLKPVWMMSPLSVSDVLPLAETLFDVVIFDEASQIPLEDAVPALYRAQQMIVVGDEMQLPPSQFFASQATEDDEQPENLHIYNLNADSFLNRAAGALPAAVLSWHYRSRHESLIGFCNQAFYGGQLQTVPSTQSLSARPAIQVDPGAGREKMPYTSTALLTEIYQRPISYHKLDNSPYHQQRNAGEANYIAQLVRELLLDSRRETIGIVAFSQAQQQEIESAMARLANQDKAFADALDAEEEREDEDQFVGLFVKNLENVQGDERDIIILSICYGPNPQGKMLMNFGPINQNGGEKRLNVIFSRAKKHMVVVTSIEASQITNTYNIGANALRQYLRYARAVSEGDTQGMHSALLEYGLRTTEQSRQERALTQAIAERLAGDGLVVATQYGQSSLTCDLAVRRPEHPAFQLAILTDNSRHYDIADPLERYHTPASVLQAFGWQVCFVLAKDWYKDTDAVIKRIHKELESDPPTETP